MIPTANKIQGVVAWLRRVRHPFALATLSVGIIIASYRFLQDPRELQKTGKLDLVLDRPKDVWVTPAQRIVATYEDGSSLHVKDWDSKNFSPNTRPVVWDIDLAQLFAGGNSTSLDDHAHSFSPDATLFAWSDSGTLRVIKSNSKNEQIGIPVAMELQPDQTVSSINFLTNDLICVIYKSGKLEAWDVARRARGRAGTWLEGPWPTWRYGDLLVAASFETRDIAEIKFSGPDKKIDIQLQRLMFSDGSATFATASGKILVGTASGEIVEIVPGTDRGQSLGYIAPNDGGVLSITDWGQDTILAAGASGIYAKIGSGAFERVDWIPSAVDRLCAVNDMLIYRTPQKMGLVEVAAVSRLWSDRGFIYSIVLSFVSLIATIWSPLKNFLRSGGS